MHIHSGMRKYGMGVHLCAHTVVSVMHIHSGMRRYDTSVHLHAHMALTNIHTHWTEKI